MDRTKIAILAIVTFIFCWQSYVHGAANIPTGLETVIAEDGSVWERVNPPGFGSVENNGIVVLCPYKGSLYAVTRNDDTGLEIWKSNDTGAWDQVTVPGLTDNNIYYGYLKPGAFAPQYDTKFNLNQNQWGDMIEYKGYLYLVVASGYQGAQLYGSIGLEIWRFDGTVWEPIVSPSIDVDETGTITGVADCADADSAYTAQLTDTTKTWTTDQWAGCVLRVEGAFDGTNGTDPGVQGLRVFDIISNTADTLTVQQNEFAGLDEYTICTETRLRIPGDFGRPDMVIPAIGTGSAYTILCGTDEAGFGQMWNKSSPDFEILGDDLYVTIGLNYEDGTRIWKTSNGTTWVPTSEYSFGLFHGLDPEGTPIADEDCPLPGLSDRNGNPVCSSSTNFGKFNNTLFTGGTGSSGCNGRGARVVRLDGDEWTVIVDYFVDENDTGSNENGFGNLGMTNFFDSNFQAWSFAQYDGHLFAGVVRLTEGCRVVYTDSGSSSDGAWVYAVGGDHPTEPDGWGESSNLGSILYNFDSQLYAGTLINNTNYPTHNGADLWKATGPADNLTWTRLTGDAFGDSTILQFEAFTSFGGTLYVAASNILPSNFPGDEEAAAAGAKIYRLASAPCVTVTEDQSVADKFTRHTVTGITTPLPVDPDVPGFIGAAFVTTGDIDEDGIKDIICASGVGLDGDGLTAGDGAIAVFTWDGSDLDSWTQTVINATFAFPNETLLRDMDGDGDNDIMVLDNFIISWWACGEGGIFWLENLGGDITNPANWVKQTIYVEPDDGGGCRCHPVGVGTCSSALTSFHRAHFLDLDGDGLEDFITTKVHMWYWQWTDLQYVWTEWFKKETDLVTYPSGFSGPYEIGDGGGFLFELSDIDGDGDEDVVAGQFFIYEAGFMRKPFGDPHGDSLIWFENPGQAALAANPALLWNRYTIDNEWTSPNTIGKCNEAVFSDIDNDGTDEIVLTNHNHQQYSSYTGSPLRYWPAGVYYLEIPENPKSNSQWGPISIETGDPNLDPDNHTAVLNDVYGVDRDFNDYNGQGSPGLVRTRDITGDGYPDMLVPGDGKGALYYYESQGADPGTSCLSFKRASLYAEVACMPGESVFDDIDGDGDEDVVAVIFDTSFEKDVGLPIESSSIFVYENTTLNPPECGNGEVEPGEECDGDDGPCITMYGTGWQCNKFCQCQEITVIELADFGVQPRNRAVSIVWMTDAEIDNAGFNLYRAGSEDGEYSRINDALIPAEGTATKGASYSFVDNNVRNGKTYWYKLEDVDLSGVSTMHGPVSATPRLIHGK